MRTAKGLGVISTSIRPSMPSGATPSSSARASASAQAGRKPDEDELSLPDGAEFGRYVAMWMRPDSASISPALPAVANLAWPRSAKPAADDRMRRASLETPRSSDVANARSRAYEADLRESSSRPVETPRSVRRASGRDIAEPGTAARRDRGVPAPQHREPQHRPPAHRPLAQSYRDPRQSQRMGERQGVAAQPRTAGSSSSEPFEANDSARETHHAGAAQARLESGNVQENEVGPVLPIGNPPRDAGSPSLVDGALASNANAEAKSDRDGSAPVGDSARPGEDAIPAVPADSGKQNQLAEGALPGAGTAWERPAIHGPIAGSRAAMPQGEIRFTSDEARQTGLPGRGLPQSAPDPLGRSGPGEPFAVPGDAANATIEAAPVSGGKGIDAEHSSAAPAIRVTVDRLAPTADSSASQTNPGFEDTARNANSGNSTTSEPAASGWASARNTGITPSVPALNGPPPSQPIDSTHERLTGAAHAAQPDTSSESAAHDRGASPAPGADAMSAAETVPAAARGERNTIPGAVAAASIDAAPASPAVRQTFAPSPFRSRASASESARNGTGPQRRMTFENITIPEASAASPTPEDAGDSQGESAGLPQRRFFASGVDPARDGETFSALPAARLQAQGNGAITQAGASSRHGAHASHPRSSAVLPGIADALLNEVPTRPGSMDGKQIPIARSLRVVLPGAAAGEEIRLRFLQRGGAAANGAGEIDVRIQSPSERVVREMRAEIPSLLHRLGQTGFDVGDALPRQGMEDRGGQREGAFERHGGGSYGQSNGNGYSGGERPGQDSGDHSREPAPMRAATRITGSSPFAENVAQALAGLAEGSRSEH
ncbi:MAG: hypothetical protein IT169_05425 [Bryobacterales bacterium]|nr:hypothetical protein [Bryobacterales bacterium]